MGWGGAIALLSKLPFYPTHPWFLHTVLAKINICHFGADSEKMMIFHFLLRSPLIYCYFSGTSFSKSHLFHACSDLGLPGAPTKNRSILFGPPWAPLCLSPRFQDPLRTFQKTSRAKNETITTTRGFTSKVKP